MEITREDKLFIFSISIFTLFTLIGQYQVKTSLAAPFTHLFYLSAIPFFLLHYRFHLFRQLVRWLLVAGFLGGLVAVDFSRTSPSFMPGVSSLSPVVGLYMMSTMVFCMGIALLVRHRVMSLLMLISLLIFAGFFVFSPDTRFGNPGMEGILHNFLNTNPIFGKLSELYVQRQSPGLLGLVGIGLVLGIPVYNMYWAVNHPDKAMRYQGIAGVIFVATVFVLLLFGPVLSNLYSGLIYVFGVMLFWAELRAREDAWLAEKMPRKETISVGVICMNEADRIEECLSAVAGWADEIVVLDSGSIDETVAEARKYTDKVFETDWPGYGPQKRRVVEKCTMDWVLSIDADEIVTERLKQEIDGVLNGESPYDGFKFAWRSEIFGGTVDFGADGRRHLRLFRRSGTAEFSHDVVHEGVISVTRVRSLHGIVIHKTFRNYAHLMDKFMAYANLQSEARFKWGRRASVYEAALRSVFSFFSLYIYRLGLLDGWRGLLMAGLYSQYTFNKYAALWVKALQESDYGQLTKKKANAKTTNST